MTRGVEHKRWARFCADEGGAAMVEFAIVSAVFFLAFFQLLGFGLFASTNLMAEKATQIAARTAVVRPAVDWCAETPLPDRITSSDPDLPEPPSSYVPGRVYFCIFDDDTGLRNRNEIGMDQITFEVDYPHADSTFPHTLETATSIADRAGLDDDEAYKLFRGNAIRAYKLERFGIAE